MGSLQPAGSLPLSVQELIKQPLISLPQHYIRSEQENRTMAETTSFTKIPTVDMKLLVSKETTALELQNLHSACKEWGIFQLVNHGVSFSLLDKLKYEIEEFYKLPSEEKMKYQIRQGEVEGYGTVARNEGKYDWGDRFYMLTNPIPRRKSHLFPELPSSLKDTLESYIEELQKVAMMLLGFIAKALNIDVKEMEELFDDGMQSLRMTHYPPCPQPELVVGITPHSDATGMTILNQLNEVDGFQIKKDGAWSSVSIPRDALVVNVGDILEILSNGLYHSVLHTVAVNSKKERLSVAFFVNPKLEAEVGPATSLLNPQNPPIFRTIGMEDYVKSFFSRKIDGKSHLESFKLSA